MASQRERSRSRSPGRSPVIPESDSSKESDPEYDSLNGSPSAYLPKHRCRLVKCRHTALMDLRRSIDAAVACAHEASGDTEGHSEGQPQASSIDDRRQRNIESESTVEAVPVDEAVPEAFFGTVQHQDCPNFSQVMSPGAQQALQIQPVLHHRTHLTIRGMEGALQNLADAVSHFRAGMSRSVIHSSMFQPNSMFNQHIEDMFQETARHFEMLSRLHRESQDTEIPMLQVEHTVSRIEHSLGGRFYRNAAQLSVEQSRR